MGLTELTPTEQLVLVGLAKAIVHADQEVSAEETAAIQKLAADMGPDAWNAAVAEARTRLRTADDLFSLARQVHGLDARETIHNALRSLAESDDLIEEEAAILQWIAEVWQLGGVVGDEDVEEEDESDPDTFDGDFDLLEPE